MSGLDGNARCGSSACCWISAGGAFSPERPAFANLCRRLILELSPTPSALFARCAPTHQLVLCDGSVPAGFGEINATVVLTGSAMRRLDVSRRSDQSPTRAACRFTSSSTVRCADRKRWWSCSAAPASPAARSSAHRPSFRRLEWLERRKPCPPGLRDHVMRALAVRATDEPQAAAAVHELQVLMPSPRRYVASPECPVGGDITMAVSTGDGGLFVAGWLHDPHNMVEGLRITSPFGEERTITDLPHRFPREDVTAIYKSASPAGFAAFLPGSPDPAPVLQYRCELLLRSGGRIDIVPPPRPLNPADVRAAVLGSMPPPFVTQAALETCIASAAALIHAALVADLPAPEVIRHGTPPAYPAVSIIIPLYKNLDFLRLQLAAFAIDPTINSAGPRSSWFSTARTAGGASALSSRPVRPLRDAADAGRPHRQPRLFERQQPGAAVARARHLLFLNSGRDPGLSGWLPLLSAELDASPKTGAVGPKLLFEDDLLQHAGLFFGRDYKGRWINQHYHKGMPRDFAPACSPAPFPVSREPAC